MARRMEISFWSNRREGGNWGDCMELEQKRHARREAEAGKPNLTGIPLQMKQSFEQSSGLSFDDVRVHYHSARPSRLGALAYTQGTHVYVAPGQERHLGHELGHVVQQKQGRVQATSSLGGVKLNTSPAMEQEADMLCRQDEQGAPQVIQRRQDPSSEVIQMVTYPNIAAMWADICGNAGAAVMIQQIASQDPVLAELYDDAARQVPNCDFRGGNRNIQIGINNDDALPYFIEYTAFPGNQQAEYYFIAAIIHELSHAAVREQYQRNLTDTELDGNARWLNMNLPPAGGANGITTAQDESFAAQMNLLSDNIEYLRTVVESDADLQRAAPAVYQHLADTGGRIDYMAAQSPDVHYDTVLGDMMFYLRFNNLQDTPSYRLMQRMLREANDRRHQRRWFGNNKIPYDFSKASRFSWY